MGDRHRVDSSRSAPKAARFHQASASRSGRSLPQKLSRCTAPSSRFQIANPRLPTALLEMPKRG